MAGSAAILRVSALPTIVMPDLAVPVDGELLSCAFHLERLLPILGPQFPGVLPLFTFELFGHPEQRAIDGGAIVSGQVHDPGLDDETAEFDQMPCAPATLDLPRTHVMPRSYRLMAIARGPVAPERCQRHGQSPLQIDVTCFEEGGAALGPCLPLSGICRFCQDNQRAGQFVGA
jgi:hypothetical protein